MFWDILRFGIHFPEAPSIGLLPRAQSSEPPEPAASTLTPTNDDIAARAQSSEPLEPAPVILTPMNDSEALRLAMELGMNTDALPL